MFESPQSDKLFKKLTRLARLIKKKKKLLVCREFGRNLALLRTTEPERIYGAGVLSEILERLRGKARVRITLDDGQAFIRLARKLNDKDAGRMAKLSVPKAIKLMTLRRKRDLHRLAERAIKGEWTSRQLIREIVAAQGYRRLDRRAKTDSTKGSKTELSEAENPTKHLRAMLQSPRLAMRELVRLTRALEQTMTAWLGQDGDDTSTILSKFRSSYAPKRPKTPLIPQAVAKDLTAALETLSTAAKSLHKIATRIDLRLTEEDRRVSSQAG